MTPAAAAAVVLMVGESAAARTVLVSHRRSLLPVLGFLSSETGTVAAAAARRTGFLVRVPPQWGLLALPSLEEEEEEDRLCRSQCSWTLLLSLRVGVARCPLHLLPPLLLLLLLLLLFLLWRRGVQETSRRRGRPRVARPRRDLGGSCPSWTTAASGTRREEGRCSTPCSTTRPCGPALTSRVRVAAAPPAPGPGPKSLPSFLEVFSAILLLLRVTLSPHAGARGRERGREQGLLLLLLLLRARRL